MKRKLLASFFFDCGTAHSSYDTPTVSIFWDLQDKDKPFQMIIRYQWVDKKFNYPFSEKVITSNWVELAKYNISENFDYKGDFKIDFNNEYYISDFGKCVKCANSAEQINNWCK